MDLAARAMDLDAWEGEGMEFAARATDLGARVMDLAARVTDLAAWAIDLALSNRGRFGAWLKTIPGSSHASLRARQ
eukprot:4145536-Lingulodinium_polyedra.AAC.1